MTRYIGAINIAMTAASRSAHRQEDHSVAGQIGGVLQRCLNILFCDMVPAHDRIVALLSRQVVKDDGNHDASALDARLAVTNARINADSVTPLQLVHQLLRGERGESPHPWILVRRP